MDTAAAYKKLAEVSALADLLTELNTRSNGLLDAKVLNDPARGLLARHGLSNLVPATQKTVFNQKYSSTTGKLTAMMETYIGDKWTDPVELSEWCGFHLGSGIVHASLVRAQFPEHAERLAAIAGAFETLLNHVSSRVSGLSE